MKRQKRLCFVFCAAILLTGAALTGCDDEVVIEEAKSIKLNYLNYGYREINGNRIDRDYTAVYSIGLMADSSGENPVYGNPQANVVISEDKNGTATIAIYELTTPVILGEPWKGSGEYFISVGLLYEGNKVDYYVSKHEVRIRRAVTEIGFEENFVYKE